MYYLTNFNGNYFSFVTNNHPSPTSPQLRGRVGDSGTKVQSNYFFSVPAVQGNLQVFDIRILIEGVVTFGSLPLEDFLLLRLGPRAKF